MASIGSRFAEEFANHLRFRGYNYIKKKKNPWNASASWGRVYTVPCINQIFHYSLNKNFPVVLAETQNRGKNLKGWFDPLREGNKTYKSKYEAKEGIKTQKNASKKVLIKAEFLVVTLGQNEGFLTVKTMSLGHNVPQRYNRK